MKLSPREKAIIRRTTKRLSKEFSAQLGEVLGLLDDLGAICEEQGKRIDLLETVLGLGGPCDCPNCRARAQPN